MQFDVLIVGAGHAGAQAAIALRQKGFAGSLAMVTEEQDPPYERPPLSKEYLAGDKDFARILIRPASFWKERGIALLTSQRVVSVDSAAHHVTTADGSEIGYGRMIWAAGGRPRALTCPGRDLTGIHVVRTRADADRIMAALPDVERAVVVGGGYIGLEAASALVKLGKRVTLVEALDRVLARVAGEPLSRFFEAEHRAHGVDLRLGTGVERILGEEGRVRGVLLSTGETVAAQMVVAGIGIAPSVEPLLLAGAEGGNGVAVDGQCRTSLADVFAVGDCALHANAFAGGTAIRLESVQNANDQATVAARAILGGAETYHAVPWFWSNQYDLKLQTVGLSTGHDVALVRGDMAARSFSVVYLREGSVVALDCVNATRDYVQGRKLVLDGARPDPRRVGDADISLASVGAI